MQSTLLWTIINGVPAVLSLLSFIVPVTSYLSIKIIMKFNGLLFLLATCATQILALPTPNVAAGAVEPTTQTGDARLDDMLSSPQPERPRTD